MIAQICAAARSSVETGRYGGDRLVRGDAAHPGGSRRMRHLQQPQQGFVEVHVTIDEARQHQIADNTEDRLAVRRGGNGAGVRRAS